VTQNQIRHFVQDDNSTSVILSRAKNLPRSYLAQYSHYRQNEALPTFWVGLNHGWFGFAFCTNPVNSPLSFSLLLMN
jgi:hypothetical protein